MSEDKVECHNCKHYLKCNERVVFNSSYCRKNRKNKHNER